MSKINRALIICNLQIQQKHPAIHAKYNRHEWREVSYLPEPTCTTKK